MAAVLEQTYPGARLPPTALRNPISTQVPLPVSTLSLVLAGGNGTRLGELTRWECKPALLFGGKFRNIDLSLSNCLHSGIRRIAVLEVLHGEAMSEPCMATTKYDAGRLCCESIPAE